MSIRLLDGDDCLDEGIVTVGEALFDVEDTEMLDEAGGSLADVEDVWKIEEITELHFIVASDGDFEVEPSILASGLKRDPTAPPSVKSDVLQQLTELSGSNTLCPQQNSVAKLPLRAGQGIMLL